MKLKNIPFSTFHYIDTISAVLANRMLSWDSMNNTMVNDRTKDELDRYVEMMNLGAWVIQTQPDECGTVRFSTGMSVVERSSGIFSQLYELTEMNDDYVVLKDESGSFVRTSILKIREDGIAFLPSPTLENDVEITGAPLNDDEMMSLFLKATVSSGLSSPAWTELRVMSVVPEHDDDSGDVPPVGTDYYQAMLNWTVNVYEKEHEKFNIGDIVVESLPSQIVSGSYSENPRASSHNSRVGEICNIVTERESGLTRYDVRLTSGGTRRFYLWEMTRLVNIKNQFKEQ